jgi:putative transcriptional regulator
MTKKSDLFDIDLNEELTAIRAQKAGKNVLRKKKLRVPSDVATIRHRLGLTQVAFSGLMGISVQTLRNWEQGTREPRGPAMALLRIVEKNPKVLFS